MALGDHLDLFNHPEILQYHFFMQPTKNERVCETKYELSEICIQIWATLFQGHIYREIRKFYATFLIQVR